MLNSYDIHYTITDKHEYDLVLHVDDLEIELNEERATSLVMDHLMSLPCGLLEISNVTFEKVFSKRHMEMFREMSEEIKTQNQRGTSDMLVAVYEDVEQVASWEYSDNIKRRDSDYICDYEDLLCKKCGVLHENGEDLPDICADCDSDLFYHYNTVCQCADRGMPMVFFTEKAAKSEIEACSHHYSNPKTYGVSACHNDEMAFVRNAILSL